MSNRAEHERPVANGPAVLIFGQADRLADQSAADVDHVAIEFDLAVAADTTHHPVFVIVRLAQDAIEAARGSLIALSRRRIVERLVRALFVVKALEGAQPLE